MKRAIVVSLWHYMSFQHVSKMNRYHSMLLFEVGKKYRYIIKTKLISCTSLRKQQKYKNVNIKGYLYNSFLYHCEQDKT